MKMTGWRVDVCGYNDSVACENQTRCKLCGFNPDVQAERVKEITARMRYGKYNERGGGACKSR